MRKPASILEIHGRSTVYCIAAVDESKSTSNNNDPRNVATVIPTAVATIPFV
jgi:hypothetical protein